MKTHREHNPCDRYVFDFDLCQPTDGWAQVDTANDAHYFGIWANPFSLKTCQYIEGDVTVNSCETVDEFIHEIESFFTAYGPDGRFGIDPLGREDIAQRFIELNLGHHVH